MRPVEELINLAEDAWPELRQEFAEAPFDVTVLPVEPQAGRDCLQALQVTTRSRLGAMALHTGGLVLDHGWLRLYGGGTGADGGLPSLADANGLLGTTRDAPASIAVGYDILGGRYEVNGPVPPGDRPGKPGEVCYFAPDSLEWEELELPYGSWLSWLASGAIEEFYASLRWHGWQEEVRALRLHQGLSVYPYLCTAEARRDLAATSRRAVSVRELFSFTASLAETVSEIPNGGTFTVRVAD